MTHPCVSSVRQGPYSSSSSPSYQQVRRPLQIQSSYKTKFSNCSFPFLFKDDSGHSFLLNIETRQSCYPSNKPKQTFDISLSVWWFLAQCSSLTHLFNRVASRSCREGWDVPCGKTTSNLIWGRVSSYFRELPCSHMGNLSSSLLLPLNQRKGAKLLKCSKCKWPFTDDCSVSPWPKAPRTIAILCTCLAWNLSTSHLPERSSAFWLKTGFSLVHSAKCLFYYPQGFGEGRDGYLTGYSRDTNSNVCFSKIKSFCSLSGFLQFQCFKFHCNTHTHTENLYSSWYILCELFQQIPSLALPLNFLRQTV